MVDLLIERGTTSVVPNFGNKALLPQFFFDEIRAPMVVFVILVEWLCTTFFALWYIELLTERSCDGVCLMGAGPAHIDELMRLLVKPLAQRAIQQ